MKAIQIIRTGWFLAILMFILFPACGNNQKAQLQRQQAEASRNLGEAYLAQGNFTLALRELLKAESLNPKDPFVQNYLGLAYMGKDKLDKAISHFQKALSINPSYAPARNNLGTAYLAKKDWDSAISTFKEVAEDILYATPHFPLSNLGWAYFNKGNYELAEKYYLEAMDIEPNFVIAQKGLARTYIAMGRPTEAISILDKAIDKTPRMAELHLELGKAYVALNQREKALDAFKKAIALNPESDVAQEEKKVRGQMLNQR